MTIKLGQYEILSVGTVTESKVRSCIGSERSQERTLTSSEISQNTGLSTQLTNTDLFTQVNLSVNAGDVNENDIQR